MDFFLLKLHYDIAQLAGKDASCGQKIKYPTYESAVKSAESFNKKKEKLGELKRLEPYPCPFCSSYHNGGSMPKEKLNEIYEQLKSKRTYNVKCTDEELENLISVDEWSELVSSGTIITTDGFGFWVKNGFIYKTSSLDFQDDVFTCKQEDATHVLWYNK